MRSQRHGGVARTHLGSPTMYEILELSSFVAGPAPLETGIADLDGAAAPTGERYGSIIDPTG